MNKALRLIFVICALMVAMSTDRLSAAGGCICSASVDAYEYGDPPTYRGSFQYAQNIGTAGSQWQCADMCQVWVNANLGEYACQYFHLYDLDGTDGYVIEDWNWYYAGQWPWATGHLIQQY